VGARVDANVVGDDVIIFVGELVGAEVLGELSPGRHWLYHGFF